MPHAIVKNGKVVQIMTVGVPREGMIECPVVVECGWSAEQRESEWLFTPPPEPTKEERRADRMNKLRNERDARLIASDRLVHADRWEKYTPEKKEKIATYRQALRDLPENVTDPEKLVWPEVPE
jgi:hypothetical protein